MSVAFACPECGSGLEASESNAGRRVRCGDCGTLVEIPFLPRSAASRGRIRRRSPVVWIVAGGLLAAVLMVVAAVMIAGSRGQAYREAEVAEAVERSAKAEASGQLRVALVECESALKIARGFEAPKRKSLLDRRNRLALLRSESELTDVLGTAEPVDALRALQARVTKDEACESLRGRVFEALASNLLVRSESDLVQANSALAAGQPETAIGFCERAAKSAEELGRERAGGLRESASNLAREILGRYGVVFAPISGEFLQGPAGAKSHSASLHPIIAATLKRKGYLPKPETSSFLREWDEASPFKFEVELTERTNGTFFQTPLHTTQLLSHFTLLKNGKYVWEARPQGQTRIPPPDMNAFEMSNISLSKTRDPAHEKHLYNDARAVLNENLTTALRTLPGP